MQLLATGMASGDKRPVGWSERNVASLYTQFKRVLSANSQAIRLLAQPTISGDGKIIDYYTNDYSVKTHYTAIIDDKERERVNNVIAEAVHFIQLTIADLATSEDSSDVNLSHAMRTLFNLPSEEYIFIVDGQPVVAFWGYGNEYGSFDLRSIRGTQPLDPIPKLPPTPEPPSELDPPLSPEQESSIEIISKKWLWLLSISLLLATLLGLLLYFFPHLLAGVNISQQPTTIPSKPPSSTDWIQAEAVTVHLDKPKETTGEMEIGIKWGMDGRCEMVDLDLMIKTKSHEISYHNKNNPPPDGKLHADVLKAPSGDSFEYIALAAHNNINDLHILVNFFSSKPCSGGVSGVIRAVKNSKIYEQPFHIESEKGSTITAADLKDLSKWQQFPAAVIVDTKQLFNLN